MGIFAVRGRRSPVSDPGAGASLTPGQRLGLPHRCEAVGEALASGSDPRSACVVAGEHLARDGVPLQEALERLRTTWAVVLGAEPSFDTLAAMAGAWTDTSLAFVNQLSCEDPLTGLASQAHLRSRLHELLRIRGAENPHRQHALVICEVGPEGRRGSGHDHLARAMALAQLGDYVRTVFPKGEPVARLGGFRIAALVERDERLGRRVRLLRSLVAGVEAGARAPRVWIEGIPGSDSTVGMLLDELARS